MALDAYITLDSIVISSLTSFGQKYFDFEILLFMAS